MEGVISQYCWTKLVPLDVNRRSGLHVAGWLELHLLGRKWVKATPVGNIAGVPGELGPVSLPV